MDNYGFNIVSISLRLLRNASDLQKNFNVCFAVKKPGN